MSYEVFSKEKFKGSTTSLAVFSVVVVIGVLIIFARLWYLQILSGGEYRQKSENNRVRIRPVPASRGLILDRHGKVMVDIRPSFDVYLLREDMSDFGGTVRRVGTAMELNPSDIETLVNKESPFKQVRIKRDIDRDNLAVLLTNKLDLPGVIVAVEPRRNYPYGTLASHLFGHIGEITDKQLTEKQYEGYRPGSLTGKSGIELKYETYLKGVDGGQYVEVDASGRELSVLKEVDAYPGNNIISTVDLELQKTAEDLFKDHAGSVIAMDPRNGEILAFISNPSVNPDVFAGPLDTELWNRLVNDPLKPLQNRAIQGQYPPGSTYKLIVAAAAIEEKVIDKETTIFCGGSYRFGNRSYRCWKPSGHGTVDLHKAIVESCDVYFYQVGRMLGIDRIAEYARKFGLGKSTGIELMDEKSGLVPDTKWRQRRFGSPWIEGETLSCAIGQGFNLTTPLQLVFSFSALANNGKSFKPQIIKAVAGPDGKILQTFKPVEGERVPLAPETFALLKSAMEGVVNEPGGTGSAARQPDIKVGGKTGTSQVVKMAAEARVKGENLPYQFRDHAWFISFAPVEDPRIAIVVLIEHSGYGGGKAAAPVAGKLFKRYFELEKERERGGSSTLQEIKEATVHDDRQTGIH